MTQSGAVFAAAGTPGRRPSPPWARRVRSSICCRSAKRLPSAGTRAGSGLPLGSGLPRAVSAGQRPADQARRAARGPLQPSMGPRIPLGPVRDPSPTPDSDSTRAVARPIRRNNWPEQYAEADRVRRSSAAPAAWAGRRGRRGRAARARPRPFPPRARACGQTNSRAEGTGRRGTGVRGLPRVPGLHSRTPTPVGRPAVAGGRAPILPDL